LNTPFLSIHYSLFIDAIIFEALILFVEIAIISNSISLTNFHDRQRAIGDTAFPEACHCIMVAETKE
jgi:hypothetical protein